MPFLAVLHFRPLACPQCGAPVTAPGARSFVVDAEGSPVFFAPEETPDTMIVEIPCANGHAILLRVPDDISAEEALMTPEDAPIERNATLKEN
ncbi:MAG: hypothetical protein JO302_01990 [Candidatus Eremiobacteraeota bacterium]|nr:hypothetical protein [Candidatus Eremiobacteraeota bacterium]